MGNGGRGGNRAKPRWMRELSASMGGGKALNSLFGGGGGNQNFGGVDGRALPNNGAVDGDWLAKGRAAKDAFFANIDNPLNNMQMPGMPGGGDGMQQGNNNPMMGNNMGNMMPSDLTKQLPNVIGLAVLCIGLTTTVGSLQGGGGVHQTLDREEISRLSRSESSSSSSSSSGRNNLRSISAAYKKPSSSSSSSDESSFKLPSFEAPKLPEMPKGEKKESSEKRSESSSVPLKDSSMKNAVITIKDSGGQQQQ